MARRLTTKDMEERIYNSFKDDFVLHSNDGYKNANSTIELRCTRCDRIKRTNMNAVVSKPTGCGVCEGNNVRFTTSEVQKKMDELTNGEYSLIGEYTNADTPMEIRHNSKNCDNHVYKGNWYNFKLGKRCPVCAEVRKGISKTISSKWRDKFKDELSTEGYILLSKELGIKKDKVTIKNKNCDHGPFDMTPDHFMRGQRCPSCLISKGETKVEEWLIENNISYISEYSFDDLVNVFNLRFDFAIFNEEGDIELLVEYDGIQHFEPVPFFGGEDKFRESVKRDNMKNEYCADRGIELLRISYLEIDKIDEILSQRLKGIPLD